MDKIYSSILEQIPDSIDFNFIPLKNESMRKIYMENLCNEPILFEIQAPENFSFFPLSGILSKEKKIEIQIKINPNLAEVLISNARISLDNKYAKIIKLSCIGKYPNLFLSQSEIDFNNVQIEKSLQKNLIISNQENIPTKFIIKRINKNDNLPYFFHLSKLKGEILKNSHFILKIKFKPQFLNTLIYETFTLSIDGGNTLKFSCKGNCSPLKIWANSKHINYKSISLGTQLKKFIVLHNDSDIDTDYQIFHENCGIFSFENLQGIIPGKSNIKIFVTFKPYDTIIYYQRVFILIKNYNLISIDLFGSCHNLLNKIPIIERKYIEIFRNKIIKGDYLINNIVKKNARPNSFSLVESPIRRLNRSNSSIKSITEKTSINADFFSVNTESKENVGLYKELFWEYTSTSRLISFDIDNIDFGLVNFGNSSEPKKLTVYNNSNISIKIKWIMKKLLNLTHFGHNPNKYDANIFYVKPEESIIHSKQSSNFYFYFKPNKSEDYFYTEIPCLGTIITSEIKEKKNLIPIIKREKTEKNSLTNLSKSKLSDFGRILVQSLEPKKRKNQSIFRLHSADLFKKKKKKENSYFAPPFSLIISLFGHSFPSDNQIYIPMYELFPKEEIYFPSCAVFQSKYQTLKIENKGNTPLYYKFSSDSKNVFRVYRKIGLIPIKSFHLVCIEFCPRKPKTYKFPLEICFNHNSISKEIINLNGICCSPLIELENIKNEIFFPPSYLGLKTKKIIKIINKCSIKIIVNIHIDYSEDGILEIEPSYFEMEANVEKKIEINLTSKKNKEFSIKAKFYVEQAYEHQNENLSIYFPLYKESPKNIKFTKEIIVKGTGSNGNLSITPKELDFGTVKVGFHKKLSFSIYNPTITNFYIKIKTKNLNGKIIEVKDFKFDFIEGIINSYCKKEISLIFSPKTREFIEFYINIYSSDTINPNQLYLNQEKIVHKENELKGQIYIKAKGDFPLIKIVDIRNSIISNRILWNEFNIDEANNELGKKITEEELAFSNSNLNIDNFIKKLKIIKFNFGKYILLSNHDKKGHQQNIYLTLKNKGHATCEFYFRFSDDINIKREYWMDPVESIFQDKVEYHILKEHIFTLEPKKGKINPNECINIRLRYNIKELGVHTLRVVFKIVNGKSVIFELKAETISEKVGLVNVPKKIIDFSYVPIGYKGYIGYPIEVKNIGTIRVRYSLNEKQVFEFNRKNDNCEIFKIEHNNDIIKPGHIKYIIAYFRPMTNKFYKMDLEFIYGDNENKYKKNITIQGIGYHPYQFTPPKILSPFASMPKNLICNEYNGEVIKNCGLNIEELDFGECALNKTKNQTFILYNYSQNYPLSFEIYQPKFILKDELTITPKKGMIEPNKYKLIKVVLTPKIDNCIYEGDIIIKIKWSFGNNNSMFLMNNISRASYIPMKNNKSIISTTSNPIEKEYLYLRVLKKCKITDIDIRLEFITEEKGSCFVEKILQEICKEILSDESFVNEFIEKIDNQPLTLYDWTNNIPITTQKEVRKNILNNVKKKVTNYHVPVNTKRSTNLLKEKNHKYQIINSPLFTEYSFNKVVLIEEKNNFGQDADLELQDKYEMNFLKKYKLDVGEVNEKMILVNEETRKLLSDLILDNTIYNIVSEAVYGLCDLTEKQKLFFFKNK